MARTTYFTRNLIEKIEGKDEYKDIYDAWNEGDLSLVVADFEVYWFEKAPSMETAIKVQELVKKEFGYTYLGEIGGSGDSEVR